MKTLYNIRKGAIAMRVDYEREAGIIEIANSLQTGSNKPQKGVKSFDWENKIVFNLTQEEAGYIIAYLTNPQPAIENINLYHSANRNPNASTSNILNISKVIDDNNVTYVNISLTRTTESSKMAAKTSISFNKNIDQISIFLAFLQKVINIPFDKDMISFMRGEKYQYNQKNQQNTNYNNNYQNTNHQSQYPDPNQYFQQQKEY